MRKMNPAVALLLFILNPLFFFIYWLRCR